MKKSQDKKFLPCIIFSGDASYAYRVRLKLSNLDLQAEYISKISDLLDFIIEHKEGIIFVSTKSMKCLRYLEKYAVNQIGRNISVIFLKDTAESSINIDNQFSFLIGFDELQEMLPVIISKANIRKHNVSTISPEEIDRYVSIQLKNFQISSQHLGYYYIKDCVQILSGNNKGEYTSIKEVYEIIANKYNKLTASIEKSIRISIGKAYQKANDFYDSIFVSERVSNLSFITFLVEKTKQMHNENSALN